MIDQLNRDVLIDSPPSRILSTVPSLTEYLIDLGLEKKLVGITKFCVRPKSIVKSIQKVGGTKNLNVELIRELKPELIVCSKEENHKEQISALMDTSAVYVSNITDLDSAVGAMKDIAELTNTVPRSRDIISAIELKRSQISIPDKKLRVCYLIWKDPYMTVGHDTFIHHMLESFGFENVFGNRNRYPKISAAQINSLKPDYVFLSSEPFPFADKHIKEIQKVINSDIVTVDGELFSWYGSRLLFSFKYLEDLHFDLRQ